MLFRRKKPLKGIDALRRWLWPERGWARAAQYFWHRLKRIADTPHGIAAGMAAGVAISFTPLVGLHLLGAWLIALTIRGNLLAAWLGTLVGNPWTFPFMWAASYELGISILGSGAEAAAFDLDQLLAEPLALLVPIILPATLGGAIIGGAAWFSVYWPAKALIAKFQARRKARLTARRRLLPSRLIKKPSGNRQEA